MTKSHVNSCIAAIVLIFTLQTFGQNFPIPEGHRSMRILSPMQVFSGELEFLEIPELKALNANSDPEIRGIMYLMAKKGIGIGLGDNSNRSSYFDLSSEVVDIILKEPAAEFGLHTPELKTEVGRLHFLTHDPIHFIPNIPGLRSSDLKDPKATKEKIVWLLLAKEALASAWSTQYYAKIYWNHRNKVQGEFPHSAFEKANNGLASIGDFTKADYMDLTISAITGQILDYYKIARRTFNYDAYVRARDAGVPMVFPRLDKKMSPIMEKLIVKYGFAPVMTLANYFFPSVGYVAFNKYARMQADFYMQPWYVRWNDEFLIGEELDSLKKSLEKSFDEYRKDIFLKNIEAPPPGLFEVMHIRNNVAHLGRKLIELQTLGEQHPGIHSNSDQKALAEILKKARELNSEILQFRNTRVAISKSIIADVSNRFAQTVQEAQVRLPVSRLIPTHLRLGMANYDHFWKDIHAVVQARPEAMTKFMSEKGVWRRALKQRLTGVVPVTPEPGKETIESMEESIAIRYNGIRRGESVSDRFSDEKHVAHRLEEYFRIICHQIQNVYIIQVQENLDLSLHTRQTLAKEAMEFLDLMNRQLESAKKGLYTSVPSYLTEEIQFTRRIELKMAAYAHILELLENQRSENRILEILERSRESSSIADANQQLKSGRLSIAKEYCSLIARACLGKNGKIILMGKIDYEGVENLAREIADPNSKNVDFIDLIDVKKNSDGSYKRGKANQYTPVRKSIELNECRGVFSRTGT
jgi:hypothetical protein